MVFRTLRSWTRTAVAAVAAAGVIGIPAPARAEPLPAPTVPLKDYDGRGYIQIDLPPANTETVTEDGKKVYDPGIQMWFPFRQAFVRPDRILVQLDILNQPQVSLAQANVERTFYPSSGVVVEHTYRNMERAATNPMISARMSMALFGKALRAIDSGKILPPEDLEKIRAANTARIAELAALRKQLGASNDPANIARVQSTAAEMARLHDDNEQLEIRRLHPCWVVEYDNSELVENLLTQGLMGSRGKELLQKGKTTVWVTKAEGLPIKVQTTTADGRVAIHFCFTQLKLNDDLHPNELVLGAPLGTRLIPLAVDLSDRNWEARTEKALEAEMQRMEDERQAQLKLRQQQRLQQRQLLQGGPTPKKRKK